MASNFTTMTNLKDYPQIVSLMEDANHIDVKVVEGSVSLRQFIAGMLSYYPWWIPGGLSSSTACGLYLFGC
jgi:hypothetical protein